MKGEKRKERNERRKGQKEVKIGKKKERKKERKLWEENAKKRNQDGESIVKQILCAACRTY